ncbi:MAG TPA: C39 family peptidase [Burkholderiaceae bacterium]|jgi:hypothetical protein|nr:C39 family peptidase [Burkholderiaceae bacterium]
MSWLSDFARTPQLGGFDLSRLQDADFAEELDELVESSFDADNSIASPQAPSSLFSGASFDNGVGSSIGSAFGAPDARPLGGLGGLVGSAVGDGYDYGPCLDGALSDSRMPPVYQGDSNACGSSSLTMIMNYLGVPVTRQDIDSEIRRVDQGLPPQPMIDYAREHGLEAEFYNNGSWDELKGFINRGIPVQAQINTEADGAKTHMHWVAVVGFRTDPKTGEEQIGVRNSAKPYKGEVQWMSRAEFEKKWTHPLDGAGYDNSFIAYAPAGTDLPPSRWDGVEGLSAMNDGAWHIANNWDRIFDPDNFGSFVHGVIGFPGGVVQTIGGAFGFGIQTAGAWLDQKVGDVPVLGWFARPVGKVLEGFGAGIGNFFGGIGDGINCIGGAFENLFNGNVGGFFGGLYNAGSKFVGGFFGAVGSVASGFVGAAGSVVDTVGDGVKAVGGAISDGVSAVGDFVSSIF